MKKENHTEKRQSYMILVIKVHEQDRESEKNRRISSLTLHFGCIQFDLLIIISSV